MLLIPISVNSIAQQNSVFKGKEVIKNNPRNYKII